MRKELLAITNPLVNDETGSLDSPKYFSSLLSTLVTVLFVVGGIGLLFMLLLGAIGWIVSGGDKAKVEQARGRITTAFAGFIVLFAVWAIITLIEEVFGVHILSVDISKLTVRI